MLIGLRTSSLLANLGISEPRDAKEDFLCFSFCSFSSRIFLMFSSNGLKAIFFAVDFRCWPSLLDEAAAFFCCCSKSFFCWICASKMFVFSLIADRFFSCSYTLLKACSLTTSALRMFSSNMNRRSLTDFGCRMLSVDTSVAFTPSPVFCIFNLIFKLLTACSPTGSAL